MAKFIEVTLDTTKEKVLVNISAIQYVTKSPIGATMIYYISEPPNKTYIAVDETYETIKGLLE